MSKNPLRLYSRRFAYLPMPMSNGKWVWLNVYYKRISYRRHHGRVSRSISEDDYLTLISRKGEITRYDYE